MTEHTVLVTDDRFGDYSIERDVLDSVGAELAILSPDVVLPEMESPSDWSEEDRVLLETAEVLLANLLPITPIVLDHAVRCHTVVRYGVGCDSVDIEAATKRGVAVATVPGYASPEVATHASALWLALERRLPVADREMRAGAWPAHDAWPIRRLSTITAGILGFGAIARALVPMIRGFGVARILVHDVARIDSSDDHAGAVESVDIPRLLAESDVLFLLAPHTPETHHVINAASLARMKRDAILINTARGGLVDFPALMQALRDGRIRAAGLDVFEQEPLQGAQSLVDVEDLVMTGHMAYFSRHSVAELKRRAAENAKEAIVGHLPASTVNRNLSWRNAE